MDKYIDISGGKMAYSVDGTGHPLVFLHGFLGNRTIWKHFVEHFKPNFKVITIDLLGHGESTTSREEISMEFSAQALKNVLEKEKITSVHIVGHSLGGYVGLAFAKLYTGDIKSLTLFNSTAKGDNKQKQADRLKAVRIFDMNPSIFIDEAIKNLFYAPNLDKFPDEVKKMTEMAKKTSILGAQASLRGMRNREDLVNWLSCQSFPVMYIAGKNDNTIPYDSVVAQINGTQAKLVTFENSGHMGFVENKSECIVAIEGFVTNLGYIF